MAPGQAVSVANGFVGTLNAGDINAPLSVDASSGTLVFGNVTQASVVIDGSADLTVGTINGRLSLRTSGSGDLKASAANDTSISISGSDDAEIGSVKEALSVEVDGSADVKIGTIDGPTSIELSGSGDVRISGGRADPFQLSSSGSGDVSFRGTATNPMISSSGSGEVCIAKVEGAIQLDGSNVTIDPNRCS